MNKKIVTVSCFCIGTLFLTIFALNKPNPSSDSLQNEAKKTQSIDLLPSKHEQNDISTPDRTDVVRKTDDKSWFKPTKEFKNFLVYQDKALLSVHDLDKFEALLNNPEMLSSARSYLLEKNLNTIDDLQVFKKARVDAVIYISAILRSKQDNSQLDSALKLAEEVLLAPLPDNIPNQNLRKFYIGDKIDLGTEIFINYKDRWNQITQESTHDKYAKLFSYIQKNAQNLQQNNKDKLDLIVDRLRKKS